MVRSASRISRRPFFGQFFLLGIDDGAYRGHLQPGEHEGGTDQHDAGHLRE